MEFLLCFYPYHQEQRAPHLRTHRADQTRPHCGFCKASWDGLHWIKHSPSVCHIFPLRSAASGLLRWQRLSPLQSRAHRSVWLPCTVPGLGSTRALCHNSFETSKQEVKATPLVRFGLTRGATTKLFVLISSLWHDMMWIVYFSLVSKETITTEIKKKINKKNPPPVTHQLARKSSRMFMEMQSAIIWKVE